MNYLTYSIDIMGPLREKLQSRYITFSILIHSLTVGLALYLAQSAPPLKSSPLITFEIAEPAAKPTSKNTLNPHRERALSRKSSPILKSKPIKQVRSLPHILPRVPRSAPQSVPQVMPVKPVAAPVAPVARLKPMPIVIPLAASISDLDADEKEIESQLSQIENNSKTPARLSIKDEELANEFSQVDKKHAAVIAKENTRIGDTPIDNDTEEQLSDMEKKNLSLLEKAQQRQRSNIEKYNQEIGQATSSVSSEGIPNGIRSLDQLRQMPGNSKPQYSYQERLRGHHGNVVFWAYVNKAGKLIKFKKAQSTGYESLDQKTLLALQAWRFYPGQEGWVELPFQWDLKGGAQEMPTLLRVKGRNI